MNPYNAFLLGVTITAISVDILILAWIVASFRASRRHRRRIKESGDWTLATIGDMKDPEIHELVYDGIKRLKEAKRKVNS